MSNVKMLIVDYTRAVTGYHSTEPFLHYRRSQFAYQAAGAALAIALRCPEYRAVWSDLSRHWEQRMRPDVQAAA